MLQYNIIVNIKNNGDAPLKLLYPYDIKGNYLGVFNFTCVCRNQKWECQSFVEEKETANLNHPKNFKYIEILPKKDVDIKVMLDKIVAPKLLPGNYTITMVYHNQMDKNCFMGEIKARNRMDITILDEKEDEPKPEYISKDEAKNILKNDWQEFLKFNDNNFFELIMLEGMVVSGLKIEFQEHIKYIKEFIPKINSWSVCDSFCSGLKIINSNKKEFKKFIEPYFSSDMEYFLRFPYVILLNYYMDDIDYVLEKIKIFDNDKYYAKMAVAW